MEKKNTIGVRIRDCRKAKGFSQEQLAEIMLTTKGLISHYENDKVDIKASVMRELADALGTTVAYLMDGTESMSDADMELLKIFHTIDEDRLRQIAIEQLKVLAGM